VIKKTNQNSTEISIWEKLDWTWAHTFILLLFTMQILLLIPGIGPFRIVMRIGSFGLSLYLLIRFPSGINKHPATTSAIAVMTVMILEFCLHPYNNSILSGAAQCAMYLSILGPIFWVRSLKITERGFENIILIIWGFHTISSIFGVLQTYFPGKFQPPLSSVIQNSKYGTGGLTVTLANGEQTLRPMGLTDQPGGAATAGFYALLFGVVIALRFKNPILRVMCMFSATVGLFCIFLSQIRSILILATISIIFVAIVLARTGQIARLTVMASGVSSLFTLTFVWAIAVSGPQTLKRFSSLFSGSAGEVYHEHRGTFLQDTIEVDFPKFPWGAGLGRWGMVNNYFSDNTDPVSQPLWVEIQWTGWLFDGGIFLVIAYAMALYLACQTAWNISGNKKLGDFALWGGLIFAYNIGDIVITFNYPIFISQGGMEFWLLNTALFVAIKNSQIIKKHPQ